MNNWGSPYALSTGLPVHWFEWLTTTCLWLLFSFANHLTITLLMMVMTIILVMMVMICSAGPVNCNCGDRAGRHQDICPLGKRPWTSRSGMDSIDVHIWNLKYIFLFLAAVSRLCKLFNEQDGGTSLQAAIIMITWWWSWPAWLARVYKPQVQGTISLRRDIGPTLVEDRLRWT